MALLFLHKGEKMGEIQNALKAFKSLFQYKYKFNIASNKKSYELELTFSEKDFYHLAGFHYIADIDIPRASKALFEKIENNQINDQYLEQSTNYTKIENSYANVKQRIYGLQFIQEYIENKNLICKYIKNRNPYSCIRADYFIISELSYGKAYIFLKQRRDQNDYCICSFFVEPETDYVGSKVYWLLKSRIDLKTKEEVILYIKNHYQPPDEGDSLL